jgi:hypothetical protein
MRRVARYAAVVIVVAMAGMQGCRPARTNPPIDPARTIDRLHPPTPAAAAVLERACRDCHSNRTVWPWYSHVAPVSWWVIDHVNHGRSHLNFSEWSSVPADRVAPILDGVCKQSRDRTMPLPSYTWMHWSARLTDADAQALCDWSRAVAGHTSKSSH